MAGVGGVAGWGCGGGHNNGLSNAVLQGSRPSVSVNERRDPPAMSVDVHSQRGERGFVSGW